MLKPFLACALIACSGFLPFGSAWASTEPLHDKIEAKQPDKPPAKAPAKGSDLESLQVKDARSLGLFPDALLAPATNLKGERKAEAETQRKELNDLWAATIAQSRDVQFVIQRLQPTSDKHHESSEALKYISGALFDIGNVLPSMLTGQALVQDGAYAGLNAMRRAVTNRQNRSKSPSISVEQATLLYYIVRQVADHLVCSYREYRLTGDRLTARRHNLKQFETLLQSIDSDITAASSVEMRYLICQAQADIDDAERQHETARLQLVELAGTDAVDRLDDQIVAEAKSNNSDMQLSNKPEAAK